VKFYIFIEQAYRSSPDLNIDIVLDTIYLKDYMSKGVPTVDEHTLIPEAAQAISESSFLIVLRKGKPIGIVTEYDLR
jgi:CBS domain-containing protein